MNDLVYVIFIAVCFIISIWAFVHVCNVIKFKTDSKGRANGKTALIIMACVSLNYFAWTFGILALLKSGGHLV